MIEKKNKANRYIGQRSLQALLILYSATFGLKNIREAVRYNMKSRNHRALDPNAGYSMYRKVKYD